MKHQQQQHHHHGPARLFSWQLKKYHIKKNLLILIKPSSKTSSHHQLLFGAFETGEDCHQSLLHHWLWPSPSLLHLASSLWKALQVHINHIDPFQRQLLPESNQCTEHFLPAPLARRPKHTAFTVSWTGLCLDSSALGLKSHIYKMYIPSNS